MFLIYPKDKFVLPILGVNLYGPLGFILNRESRGITLSDHFSGHVSINLLDLDGLFQAKELVRNNGFECDYILVKTHTHYFRLYAVKTSIDGYGYKTLELDAKRWAILPRLEALL